MGQQLLLSHLNSNNATLCNPAAWNTNILNIDFIPKNEIHLNYLSQWTNIELGPRFYELNYKYTTSKNVFVGAELSNETFGPWSQTSFSTQYAYRFFITPRSFISGGGSINAFYSLFNAAHLTFKDLDDQVVLNNKSQLGLSFSPGIFYLVVFPKDFYFNFGLALKNINLIKVSSLSKRISSANVTFLLQSSIMKFLSKEFSGVSYYEISLDYRRYNNFSDDLDFGIKYQHRNWFSVNSGLRLGTINSLHLNGIHSDFGFPIRNLIKKNNSHIQLYYSIDIPLVFTDFQVGFSHEFGFEILF